MKGFMKRIGVLFSLLILAVVVNYGEVQTAGVPTEGSITIQKFELPDDVSAGEVGTGVEDEGIPDDVLPLAGISFSVVRVEADAETVDDAVVMDGEEEKIEKTNSSGIAKFENLPIGVYLVTELENDAVVAAVDPFLVRIPTTNPTGTGLLYDVFVYPKNKVKSEGIEINKTVGEDRVEWISAGIGENIEWQISSTIPERISSGLQFDIIDNLGQAMDYAGNLKVTTIGKDGTKTPIENVESGTTYYTVNQVGNDLRISFSGEGRTMLAAAAATQGDGDAVVEIVLETRLNEQAAGLLGEKIENGASVYYKNNVERELTPDVQNRPYVITGGIYIKKVDENGGALAGAKFKIYDNRQAAIDRGTGLNDPDGKEWEITTNDQGEAVFAGLAFNDYWVAETKAPQDEDGKFYNLPEEPEDVAVNSQKAVWTLEVQNTKTDSGFVLPLTGGRGTLWFTVVGLLLIGLGLFLFIASRRKKDEKTREL